MPAESRGFQECRTRGPCCFGSWLFPYFNCASTLILAILWSSTRPVYESNYKGVFSYLRSAAENHVRLTANQRLLILALRAHFVRPDSLTKFFSIQIPNQKVCCCFNRPQKILRSIKVRQSVFFTSVFDHLAISNHIFDMVSDVFI